MRALTAIGEVGIETGGRSYLLRPSLFSMSQIGTPADIVETAAILISPEPTEPYLLKAFRKLRFDRALTVLYACAGDQDIGELVGGLVPANQPQAEVFSRVFKLGELASLNYRPRYVAGALPMADIVALAQALIRHGIMGDVEATAAAGTPMKEFKAADFVATAIAHLGMSESDAWNMTMTSFVQVMHSKYPPPPGQPKPMTAAGVEATLDRLKKINAMRAGKSNG